MPGVDYEQVPQFCYDLAKHRLTGASIGFVARTDRAFQSGRLAKESLRIGASYHQAEAIGLQLAHWIVLKSPSSTSPCRVTTKRGLNKLLGQNKAGPSAVWEALPSITELQTFCVALGIRKGPGAFGLDHSCSRTNRSRRRLDFGMAVGSGRRTSYSTFSGEDGQPSHAGQAVRPLGCSYSCSSRNSLPERGRDPQLPEERDSEPFTIEGGTEHRIHSFTKEAAKVPKEAEGLSFEFPVKPSARQAAATMDLDKGCRTSEFNGKLDPQGRSFSNKKDSHVGLGTGVDFETELTLPK